MQHLGLLDCLSWHNMSRDRDIILYLSDSVVLQTLYQLFLEGLSDIKTTPNLVKTATVGAFSS